MQERSADAADDDFGHADWTASELRFDDETGEQTISARIGELHAVVRRAVQFHVHAALRDAVSVPYEVRVTDDHVVVAAFDLVSQPPRWVRAAVDKGVREGVTNGNAERERRQRAAAEWTAELHDA